MKQELLVAPAFSLYIYAQKTSILSKNTENTFSNLHKIVEKGNKLSKNGLLLLNIFIIYVKINLTILKELNGKALINCNFIQRRNFYKRREK